MEAMFKAAVRAISLIQEAKLNSLTTCLKATFFNQSVIENVLSLFSTISEKQGSNILIDFKLIFVHHEQKNKNRNLIKKGNKPETIYQDYQDYFSIQLMKSFSGFKRLANCCIFLDLSRYKTRRQKLLVFFTNFLYFLITFILIMNSLSQTKQQYMTFLGQTSHAIPTNEDQYISQFLVFESDQKSDKNNVIEEAVQPLQEEDQNEQPDQIYEESSPAEEESSVSHKAKRSPLHNFQKHFVTTIRRSVRLKWPEEPTGYLQLAKQMWEIFKNSRKYTKQFVSLILGQNDPQIDPELLKKYGLLECVNKYDQRDYHKAQSYLKTKVLETFKQIPKQKIMYQRRIGKKQQFANYFFKVLAEIQEGVMNKRLPKKKRGGRRNSYLKSKKENMDPKAQENQEIVE